MTLKGERTDGFAVKELGTPGFREVSYGVQASQPLIQGGKLYRTYRQSKSAWESAVAKREKARQEVLFALRESTWNYVKACGPATPTLLETPESRLHRVRLPVFVGPAWTFPSPPIPHPGPGI